MTDETKEDKPDLKLSGGKDANWWHREVTRTRKSMKDYRDRARAVVRRYRDERDESRDSTQTKKFNILFSNTETLKPAIYSQVPIPDIRRRWQDKDPVAKMGALVLQRSTQYCMESYDFDSVLDACASDYLLPGFAVARVKYKPYIKSQATPEDPAAGTEEMVWEEVQTEYVPWDRFIMSRSRQYDRVWYVGFGDDLTKSEVAEQFGREVAEELSYSRIDEDDPEKNEAEATARVWEIWCKRGRGRFVIAEGFDGWLKEPEPDPLKLERFFPNSRPLWSVATTDTLKPIPEYCEYQDQALELDDITERIDVLTSALRRRGVYDSTAKDIADMLGENCPDNHFVPVENWASFVGTGGLEKLALELPLDGVVKAITALDARREVVKQTIYEVTGIADIVRGSSNPNETLGAQQLKGKWAGLRISTRQKKFANFARDLVRLKSEVIAERFKPETLSLMTGIQLPFAEQKQQWQAAQQAMQQQFQMAQQQHQAAAQAAQQAGGQPPPPPQQPPVNPEEQKFYAQPTWEEVIQVLRDDKLRGFKIDIETDSTVQPDADAEKQARTELLTGVADFCQRTGYPMPPQLAGQLITFTTRAFKVGSQMEQELEVLEQNQGPTPQQQQKEKELQEREAKVKQAEEGAKDATHKAQLAAKDTEKKADKLTYDTQVFDLTQKVAEIEKRMQEEVQQIREQFEQRALQAVDVAEGVMRERIRETNEPRGGGSPVTQ